MAHCFERAIALNPEYVHFGFSAAGDARAGAAQLYRLLPDGAWARPVIGVARDLDRAVALAREALEIQPVRIEYAKELGVALLCRAATRGGDRAEAQRVLRDGAGAAGAHVVRAHRPASCRRSCSRARRTRACGYSRDAWDAGALVAGTAAVTRRARVAAGRWLLAPIGVLRRRAAARASGR